MHIIYIHQYFNTPKGSGGIRSYAWSRKLITKGHKVTIISGVYDRQDITFKKNDSHVKTIDIDGISIQFINESYADKLNLFQRIIVFRRFANRAYHEIIATKPDLIFATSTPLTVGLPAKKAAKKFDVPFVFEVRDLWPEIIFAMGAMRNPLTRWYLTNMEHSIYKAAKHIIALSPGMKEGICKTGYPRQNVTVIPNCCDLDLFQPKPQDALEPNYGKPSDIRFIFTGAHGIANGLDAVLDGVAELKKRNFKGVHFVFIGDGSQKLRLMQRTRDESLEDYITWVDPIKKMELADLLPRMDVGMMILANIPEFYYGTSPNKFFDYIASGLPVLNNYPGWLADIIQKNSCGLVAKPDDPADFADKVEMLCQSSDMRKQMSIASRKLAESEFSRDVLGDKFVATLEAAVK
ncbi:MAG: glycosyltransferase family 4 protein [bacterium]|nr:MAG: glycosyltransferase family 4 protein [bacterium]